MSCLFDDLPLLTHNPYLNQVQSWRLNLAASSSDGNRLFYAIGNRIHVYFVDDFSLIRTLEHPCPRAPEPQNATADSPDGMAVINRVQRGYLGTDEVLVCVDDSGLVVIFFIDRLDSHAPIVLENSRHSTWAIAVHASKYLVAVGSNAHVIRMWNLRESVDDYCEFIGHGHNIPCLDFTPDGRYLVSVSIDGTLKVWDTETQQCVCSRMVTSDSSDNLIQANWGWSVKCVSLRHSKPVLASLFDDSEESLDTDTENQAQSEYAYYTDEEQEEEEGEGDESEVESDDFLDAPENVSETDIMEVEEENGMGIEIEDERTPSPSRQQPAERERVELETKVQPYVILCTNQQDAFVFSAVNETTHGISLLDTVRHITQGVTRPSPSSLSIGMPPREVLLEYRLPHMRFRRERFPEPLLFMTRILHRLSAIRHNVRAIHRLCFVEALSCSAPTDPGMGGLVVLADQMGEAVLLRILPLMQPTNRLMVRDAGEPVAGAKDEFTVRPYTCEQVGENQFRWIPIAEPYRLMPSHLTTTHRIVRYRIHIDSLIPPGCGDASELTGLFCAVQRSQDPQKRFWRIYFVYRSGKMSCMELRLSRPLDEDLSLI